MSSIPDTRGARHGRSTVNRRANILRLALTDNHSHSHSFTMRTFWFTNAYMTLAGGKWFKGWSCTSHVYGICRQHIIGTVFLVFFAIVHQKGQSSRCANLKYAELLCCQRGLLSTLSMPVSVGGRYVFLLWFSPTAVSDMSRVRFVTSSRWMFLCKMF